MQGLFADPKSILLTQMRLFTVKNPLWLSGLKDAIPLDSLLNAPFAYAVDLQQLLLMSKAFFVAAIDIIIKNIIIKIALR